MPHTTTTPPALQDGDLLAAIDLGSNSFHMVIARYTLGQLRVIDRLRETVRMADGPMARVVSLPLHANVPWNAWPASASASAMCRRTGCVRWPPTPCASCARRSRSRFPPKPRSGMPSKWSAVAKKRA